MPKITAGGQSLVPMRNFRLLRPSILVDFNRISGLAFVDEAGTNIGVGNMSVAVINNMPGVQKPRMPCT